MAHNQFELLKQRRFLPFFLTQALGAFNDNVYRQAIIGLLGLCNLVSVRRRSSNSAQSSATTVAAVATAPRSSGRSSQTQMAIAKAKMVCKPV